MKKDAMLKIAIKFATSYGRTYPNAADYKKAEYYLDNEGELSSLFLCNNCGTNNNYQKKLECSNCNSSFDLSKIMDVQQACNIWSDVKNSAEKPYVRQKVIACLMLNVGALSGKVGDISDRNETRLNQIRDDYLRCHHLAQSTVPLRELRQAAYYAHYGEFLSNERTQTLKASCSEIFNLF